MTIATEKSSSYLENVIIQICSEVAMETVKYVILCNNNSSND